MSEDAGWFGIKRGLSAWFAKLTPSVEHIRDENVDRLSRIAEGAKNRIALTQLLGSADVTTSRVYKTPKWSIYESTGRYQNIYNEVYLESQGKVIQTDPVTFSPVNQE